MSTFIIAELGSSHDGSFGNAKQMVKAAAECRVDAVKFQLHVPNAVIGQVVVPTGKGGLSLALTLLESSI
jgi:sialic acid synthase SpsE